jgi:predicted alpha/beta-fold hydrolase
VAGGRVTEPFEAPVWLRNPHAQTIWGKFFRRTIVPPMRMERWELPDGDFLDLCRMEGAAGRPRLIMLHGLEGTVRSHYARAFFADAHRRGWAADLIIFRTCGDEPNRLLRSYHSGETGDLDLVVTRLTAAEPARPVVLAGVSLGGNVLLKWLGERGANAPPSLAGAAAISTPLDLARGSRFMEQGISRVYGTHFLRTLRKKAREKSTRFPGRIRLAEIEAARTLWEFDDVMTAPVHGFRDAADYYARSSSINFLHAIRVPTLLLNAVDDPFLPPDVLDAARVIALDNPALHIEFPERGGHVGFVGGKAPWSPRYYGERRALDFLEAQLARRVDGAVPAR